MGGCANASYTAPKPFAANTQPTAAGGEHCVELAPGKTGRVAARTGVKTDDPYTMRNNVVR